LDHPSQIFDRIRRQKARPALARRDWSAPAPAPAPIPAADRPAPPTAPAPATMPSQPPAPSPAPSPATPPAPAPTRGHALYTQLMRSHDRMGTRHV